MLQNSLPKPTAGYRAPHGQRVVTVRPVEGPPVPVAELSQATWMVMPQDLIPALPGQPPTAGYIVLVPADRVPTAQPQTDRLFRKTEASPSGVRIDMESRTAEVDGRELELPRLEFDLLAHLVTHPHRVYTREQLLSALWQPGWVGDHRTVDVHVARLRRKLGPRHRPSIATVRGVGYKYVPTA
jgi:hypothetical protein